MGTVEQIEELLTQQTAHLFRLASTEETADYLLAQVGVRREAADEAWPGGLKLLSRARKGKFEVYGFDGAAGPDHMRHLHNLAAFWERFGAE